MKKTLEIFKLDGQIAVVTGGLGNLGPFWVKALIEAGSQVVCIDLPNLQTPSLLKPFLNKSLFLYSGDITNLEILQKLHSQILKEIGLVTILVNNAGIDAPPLRSQKGNDINKYKKMWDVNMQGLVNCIEIFSKDMVAQKKGSIINIGSLYGETSPDERLYNHLATDKPWAYGATKAGVLQVTRHFATRLAKYNIRVNALSPGGVFNNQDKEFVKKYSEKVPLGRMADKETDLAGPLVFLASDASSYVTGINLQVNGGYTAW